MKHFKELDGIRGIAALMIMFFHFFNGFVTNDSFILLVKKVAMLGQSGVTLFFVLSGFLITRILLATKDTPGYFKNFYVRRALRIFPLYYFYLFFVYLIIPVVFSTPFVTFNLQFYYWIYMQGLPITFEWQHTGPKHFWSLAVEEHFYLFWPLVIYYVDLHNIIAVCMGIMILSIVTRLSLFSNNLDTFYFTFSRMDELAIGCILAVLEKKNLLQRKYKWYYIGLTITMLIPFVKGWSFGSNVAGFAFWKYAIPAFMYFGLIGSVVIVGSKMLSIKPLTYTGKISYGLYVYHPICFSLLRQYVTLNNILLEMAMAFVIIFILSTLSYYLFESKFLHFKKYFEYQKPVISLV